MREYVYYAFIGLCMLLFALPARAQEGDGNPIFEPACFNAIGAVELFNAQPELLGQNVSIGIVEVGKEDPCNPVQRIFLPNLTHHSLSDAYWRHINNSAQNTWESEQFSDHASTIAGLLVGLDRYKDIDRQGIVFYRGLTPEAIIDVYETNWFLYQRILLNSHKPLDVDVLTMSWGTVGDDLMTMWWQRGIDALVERESVIIVAAGGNGDSESAAINKPSWGHNIISVAASESLGAYPASLQYIGPPAPGLSSFGPTEDGRCKPDLMAPGLCRGPAGTSATDYICIDKQTGYSSFAAPQVAGAAALLVDASRRQKLADGDDPRVVRALLMNGANKLIGWHKGRCEADDDHVIPLDFQQGTGMLDVWKSYRQLTAGRYPSAGGSMNAGWDLNEVSLNMDDPNSERIYQLADTVAAGQTVTVTLCWYRHYQDSGYFAGLPLANLSLELWSVNEQGELLDLLDYSESRVDNVQHIYYQNDKDRNMALVVHGDSMYDLPEDREQFGIAWCGDHQNWEGDRLAGDVNADGIVNADDWLRVFQVWWLQKEYPGLPAHLARWEDVNRDGKVNHADIDIIDRQWMKKSAWFD